MYSRITRALALLFLVANSAFAQPGSQANLDAKWADLAIPDEARATRAVLALATTPKETIALLQERLKPVKVDAKRVAQLVKQLESTNFVTRAQANAELEYLGKYIKADLEVALKNTMDTETKSRIHQLIEKMPKDAKAAPPPLVLPNGPPRSVGIRTMNGKTTIIIDGVPLDFSKLTPPPPPQGPPASWVRAVRAVTLLEHLATPEARALLLTMAGGESDALPTVAAREALERLKK